MVIVFDMVSGEVEYVDGDARTSAGSGMRCPGYREVPAPVMEPQLGLQLAVVEAEPQQLPFRLPRRR